MENGTRGVKCLKLILNIESRENVLGVSDRQVGAVGVVRGVIAALGGGDDAGEALDIMFCKAEGGGFGRSGLKVVKVAVLGS